MSDDELWEKFHRGTLPMDEWTHRAHVRMAYLYVKQHDFAAALDLIRAAIQAYNKMTQTPEAIDRGYHETITRAFLTLVCAAYRQENSYTTSTEFCEANPKLMSKQVLKRYYSSARIVSWEAKREFVTPDLEPLPKISGE